jgi:gliding motility-associated-like protein
MYRKSHIFRLLLLALFAVMFHTPQAKAAHIIGGDIYWECLPSGQFEFYLTLYRDCSVNTQLSAASQNLEIVNADADTLFILLPLTLQSQTDITPLGCGFTCADELPNISVEAFLFKSAPITLNITPGPGGLEVIYKRCCRNPVDNLLNAETEEIYYTATMYPFNGQGFNPCFDSSPQFAEQPTSILCSDFELQYNSNAIDTDLDSLSYEFAAALGNDGLPIPYTAGYSANSPLPGTTLNPTYDNITINPVTGQIIYDAPPGVQGRWNVAVAVTSWRCGQRISKTIREMSVTIIPCNGTNDIPSVSTPAWTAPVSGTGYDVTVQAGDLVNFSITGTDDIAQVLEFTAAGSQFGTNFTDDTGGCLNPPCATLSNPPSTGAGSISTIFNWETDCDHIAVQDACGNVSNTYNFIFTYRDDFCPTRAFNMVNVSVTVVGEPIIPSPQPHCASTAANGDITLSWEPVVDNNVPQSFLEYAIYHSTSPNGPFQEVGAVANIATDTYLHDSGNTVAAPSMVGPNYYEIRTRSGCDQVEAAIATISSIFLTVTDNMTTADLSWNAVSTPAFSSTDGLYDVYRFEPGGAWTIIGTTSDLFYSDPVIWCQSELITYRVELADNLPCTSVSNEASENLNNPATPDPQPIDSVTVINELARISWLPNAQLNVVEYTVEQSNMGIWSPLFTAVGYNNTDWTNPSSNAANEVETYRVKATNNCLITGSAFSSHRTILASAEADGCDRFSNIQWTEYVNWPEGVREYEIYASLNGTPEIWIGTVADTVFEFRHENVQEEATYCYRVVAVRDTPTRITSTSNDTCVFIYVPKRPDYGYSYETTVIPGNTGVDQFFFVDSTAGYLGFEIQRGTDPADMGDIWFVPFDATTRYYDYTDAGARPKFNSYYYSVIGIDSCDLNADTLNMTRTILLEAEANSDRTNALTWNPYESWSGSIVAYNIHRTYNGVLAQIASVPPTQLTYTDSIEEIIKGDGNFCYYIEAIEGIGTAVGNSDPVRFEQTSRSNDACALQQPNIFVPNAFVPGGVNNVFNPVTVYADMDNYLLQIYDRWGNRIFETTDPEVGWDGKVGGKLAKTGAYAYLLSVQSSRGNTFVKRGTITMIP